MRIISGKFKNRKLIQPSDNQTRPLKDVTKESIFNVLIHSKYLKNKINNLKVLDLFSGTGSFGLECISRGASKVFFFENYNKSLQILHKNIKKLKCENKAFVIDDDAFNFYKNNSLKKQKLDLIFLDPPYKDKNLKFFLNLIKNGNILDTNGIVIMHRHKNEIEKFPSGYQVIEKKNYGLSKIIFLNILN